MELRKLMIGKLHPVRGIYFGRILNGVLCDLYLYTMEPSVLDDLLSGGHTPTSAILLSSQIIVKNV